jgi:riboflavin kinase / FMN adenylyltransferase
LSDRGGSPLDFDDASAASECQIHAQIHAIDRITMPQSFTVVRDSVEHAAPQASALAGAVLALGNFEGVHRGHRALIDTALARARSRGAKAAVLTFEPHPRAFFKPDEPVFRLTSVETKLRLFAATGLDGAVVMTFDAALAALEAWEFVDRILIDRYRISGAVVGFDFRFGKGRVGSSEFLAEEGDKRGFTVDVIAPVTDGDRRISSGEVRTALAAGDVEDAMHLLGYPWFITGEVVHGDKRGRELGYPTANLRLDPTCGLRHGIYAVRVGVGGKRYDGVASFGRRPMFDTGAVLLEVFLFDFSGDLYGRTIDVAFVAWIRHELKLDSIEELVRRMDEDSRIARAALAKVPAAFPPVAP